MKNGLYRLMVTNRSGAYDYFPGAIFEGELKAWNGNFSISGSVNYYTSEIYIMKSSKEFVKNSIIDFLECYYFSGETTINEQGFTLSDPNDLGVVVVGIREDINNYM